MTGKPKMLIMMTRAALADVDRVANITKRTRSAVVREALERYVHEWETVNEYPPVTADALVTT